MNSSHLVSAVDGVAEAITPRNAIALTTPNGGRVSSLTEAVVYAAENLGKIADAINNLADAVRDHE